MAELRMLTVLAIAGEITTFGSGENETSDATCTMPLTPENGQASLSIYRPKMKKGWHTFHYFIECTISTDLRHHGEFESAFAILVVEELLDPLGSRGVPDSAPHFIAKRE